MNINCTPILRSIYQIDNSTNNTNKTFQLNKRKLIIWIHTCNESSNFYFFILFFIFFFNFFLLNFLFFFSAHTSFFFSLKIFVMWTTLFTLYLLSNYDLSLCINWIITTFPRFFKILNKIDFFVIFFFKFSPIFHIYYIYFLKIFDMEIKSESLEVKPLFLLWKATDLSLPLSRR